VIAADPWIPPLRCDGPAIRCLIDEYYLTNRGKSSSTT
jgi:hypothetical protein